jgi:hypothetical protein
VAGAESIMFQHVAAQTAKAMVLFQDTRDPKTSRLLVLVDELDRGGFPSGGGDIQINWNSGPTRIFRL